MKKRLPEHVWRRSVEVLNGTYVPKGMRKVINSKKQEVDLSWVDLELELAEVEEKIRRRVGNVI